MRKKLVKHLLLSDLHIPDVNIDALHAVYKMIPDLKPDYLHINGDFLNFTGISKYTADPYYHVSITDEIQTGRILLHELITITQSSNPKCKIYFKEGNHEFRLQTYLATHAEQLADLAVGGVRVISIKHLLELDKYNVEYLPYRDAIQFGDVLIEHGDTVRMKAGYTAHGMLDKRGMSVIIGHTHRLALVTRSQFGRTIFGIEGGCLCNLNPTPRYAVYPDWTNGFAVAYADPELKTFHPQVVPIINNSFVFNGKLYKP